MKQFDTVAKLKLAKLKEGQFVETGGYYTGWAALNISFASRYFIKTEAQAIADGDILDGWGNVQLANGNWGILQIDGAVNVKQFGAKGDGTTDDSDAIQAALDTLQEGGTVSFPTSTYVCALLSITDIGNVTLETNGSTLKAIAGTPDHILSLVYTGSSFQVGAKIDNLTLDGVCGAGIKVVGGAISNLEFSRIFSNSLDATYLIYHYNHDSPVRNPSNFIFDTIWNKSFAVKHCIYYDGVVGSSVDNFEYSHILHWSNQVAPSVIEYVGAAAQYSAYRHIYGALYAENAAVIKTNTVTITRSNIAHVLMEGAQNDRAALEGNYLETKISNVVNFYDESTYTGNSAIKAKLQVCELLGCILQDSGSGYSSLPSVIALPLSFNTTYHGCETIDNQSTSDLIVVGNLLTEEEGSFTPEITFGGSSVGNAYDLQVGHYNKQGNIVHINIDLSLSAIGSSGNAAITGLPFTSKSGVNSTFRFRFVNGTFAGVLEAQIDGGASTLLLKQITNAGSLSSLTDSNITTSSFIRVTGFYFI